MAEKVEFETITVEYDDDGIAMLVNSAFSRILAGIFLRLARTQWEVRVFGDEASARAWLVGFIEAGASATNGGPR